MSDNRFNLDEMGARLEELERAEKVKLGLDPDGKALVKVEDAPAAELVKLRDENDKMRALINRVLDARNAAREFLTIWTDPRKLPALIQEIYNSHPDIEKLRQEVGIEAAQRAARQIAHMALTYELHPLISGMFYAWEQDGKIIVEIGYRGYNEMLKRDGMDWSTRAMTPEECLRHGVNAEDRGYLCFVHDWARLDRFRTHGQPDPEPYRGIGIWRKGNGVPKSKSSEWVSEKNAIKAAARMALRFAVVKTADADTLDFVYNADEGAWSMPIQTAAWLNNPALQGRFAALLASNGLTEDEFNAFLGHDWHYTQLEPEAIHEKVLECAKVRLAVVIEEVEAALETEPPALQATESAEEKSDGDSELPAEVSTPAMCANCGVETAAGDGPYPDLCLTCARRKADAQAAQ